MRLTHPETTTHSQSPLHDRAMWLQERTRLPPPLDAQSFLGTLAPQRSSLTFHPPFTLFFGGTVKTLATGFHCGFP